MRNLEPLFLPASLLHCQPTGSESAGSKPLPRCGHLMLCETSLSSCGLTANRLPTHSRASCLQAPALPISTLLRGHLKTGVLEGFRNSDSKFAAAQIKPKKEQGSVSATSLLPPAGQLPTVAARSLPGQALITCSPPASYFALPVVSTASLGL